MFQSGQWFPAVLACDLPVFSTGCRLLAVLVMYITPFLSLLQTVGFDRGSPRTCGPQADIPEWRFPPLSCIHLWSRLRMDGFCREAQCRNIQPQSAAIFVCLFIYFNFNHFELKLKCRVLLGLSSWWTFKWEEKYSRELLLLGGSVIF